MVPVIANYKEKMLHILAHRHNVSFPLQEAEGPPAFIALCDGHPFSTQVPPPPPPPLPNSQWRVGKDWGRESEWGKRR